MNSDESIESLIRKYVETSVKQLSNSEVAVALAKRQVETLEVLKTRFDSWVWPERFWLYALIGIVAQKQKTAVLASRLLQEDDPRCLRVIEGFLKLSMTPDQAPEYFPDTTEYKHPIARKIAERLCRSL